MSDIKEEILDVVRDHLEKYLAYPEEVDIDDQILTWDEYWSYITREEVLWGTKSND